MTLYLINTLSMFMLSTFMSIYHGKRILNLIIAWVYHVIDAWAIQLFIIKLDNIN